MLSAPRRAPHLVRGDGAVAGGVGDAGQHKAVCHLLIVEEGLVGLVDLSVVELARARGAGACAWQRAPHLSAGRQRMLWRRMHARAKRHVPDRLASRPGSDRGLETRQHGTSTEIEGHACPS